MFFQMNEVSTMKISNDKIRSSTLYIGYLILEGIKNNRNDKISIYEISDILNKKGITSSRQLILGLSFLFSVDILHFEETNIWIKK